MRAPAPDPHPGHQDQEPVLRVGLHHSRDLSGQGGPLGDQPGELFGQDRHDCGCCFGAGYDHALLAESVEDLLGHARGQAGCVPAQPGVYMRVYDPARRCAAWPGWVSAEQIRDRRMRDPRAGKRPAPGPWLGRLLRTGPRPSYLGPVPVFRCRICCSRSLTRETKIRQYRNTVCGNYWFLSSL